MTHYPYFSKAPWFFFLMLFLLAPLVSLAMSGTHVDATHLGVRFSLFPDIEHGSRLIAQADQTELDLTSQYYTALPCRFSEEPKVEGLWNPNVHHQFFSARVRWRCGETVFEGRLGAMIEPSRSSLNSRSKYDFHFHVFSVQAVQVNCQEALSPAEMR